MNKENNFSKFDTLNIKSVAILLMVIHHLFLTPDRINHEVFSFSSKMFLGENLLFTISGFGKICVALFMFLSGFGLYRKFGKLNDSLKIFNGIFNSIKKTYISYWKIFIIFIPIGFIFFSHNSEYTQDLRFCFAYSSFSWKNVLLNFIGWYSNLNLEWWFLLSYILSLFSFPFFLYLLKKRTAYFDFAFLIIYSLAVLHVFPSLRNIDSLNLKNSILYNLIFCPDICSASFVCGMIFSKNERLEKLTCIFKELGINGIVFDFAGLGFIFFLRSYLIKDFVLDAFFCPFFVIFATDIFRKLKFLNFTGQFLGKQSRNIWLFHSFFIYYYGVTFQKILFFFKNPVLIAIFTLSLCIAVSFIVSQFYKALGYMFNFMYRILKIKFRNAA